MGEISRRLHVKLKAMASNVLLPRSSKGRQAVHPNARHRKTD